MTIHDPLTLRDNVKKRYDHQRDIFPPKTQYEWMNLRLQDYSRVSNYNSKLFRIISQLKLCGEQVIENAMFERTLSTFHASNIVLQQ